MNNKIKQEEAKVLPADVKKDTKLGFVTYEYLGSDCYLLNNPEKKPITEFSGIQIGDKLVVWESWIIEITNIDIGSKKATGKTIGGTIVPMAFDIDDRHCWVAIAMINPKCLKKLKNIKYIK